MATETPARSLREAIGVAFRDRADVLAYEHRGTEIQAWAAYARLLGMTPSELAWSLAPAFGVAVAGIIAVDEIDASVLALVPFAFCQKHGVLPLRWRSGALEVAMSRPGEPDVMERLAFVADKPVRALLASPESIEDAILAAYARDAIQTLQRREHFEQFRQVDENTIVRLTRELIARAVRARASDLHIQPFMGVTVARVRVDGAVRRLTVLPDAVATMVIRHVKARGGMQPTTVHEPQDGRMTLVVDGREYALRLSTLPVMGGERLVIRFLLQSRTYRIEKAGFSLAASQILRRAVARPSGLIVFTGPTGSGKTSTLYALLNEVNRSDVNIITVEDPVEYRVTGISQVEVNAKANRGFGTALRSILRQDPDVILIGEIRDRETAEIATQAALTGHLVLTTLHTNDAMTAIPRLLELGVQPSVLGGALALLASQRLCRRLCMDCRVPVGEVLSPLERMFLQVTHNQPAYRAVGCAHCEFTGFLGRLPIVDIAEMNPRLREAVSAGESRLSVLNPMREGGLKSLAASGSLRVISGDTTVLEAATAVGPSFWTELAEHYGTYFSAEAIESAQPTPVAAGFGVLLIGGDRALAGTLGPALAEEGMRLVQVGDSEAAGWALKEDQGIAFIVGDLPDTCTHDEAVALLQKNRAHIAWARLPAVVLLPEGLAHRKDALRDSGVMAAFIDKPVNADELLNAILRTYAH